MSRLTFILLAALLWMLGFLGAKLNGIAAPYAALDFVATLPAVDRTNAIEMPGETFPGSAFFFAQGAFHPAPQADGANAHILPLRKVAAPLSVPFVGATALDRYRALNCLTSAIYYEAANEPDEGQRAVAQVVLNRVRHPAWPGGVCAVVYQGSERADLLCQFTFSCDGAMARRPDLRKWARARQVAQAALNGEIFAPVGYSTYYHTLAVRPDWSTKLDPVAVVGAHIFYRMRGLNGEGAFTMTYWGHEPISSPAPRIWKPLPVGALPVAMPYLPESETRPLAFPANLDIRQHLPGDATYPPTGEQGSPYGSPHIQGENLPDSRIRPEYRDSGRPLIQEKARLPSSVFVRN